MSVHRFVSFAVLTDIASGELGEQFAKLAIKFREDSP